MSIQLLNTNNSFTVSNISSGVLVSNNGEIQSDSSIIPDINSLQTDVSSIQVDINQIQQEINNLAGLTLDQTVNYDILVSSNSMPYFASNWTDLSNSLTSNMVDMCCSGDGRVVFVGKFVAGSDSRISRDYGKTWTSTTSAGATVLSCAASLDGKYIVVNDLNNYKISSNYGVSFSLPSNRPFQLQNSAISATGKYIAAACSGNQGLQVSSDYGATWVVRETTTSTWTDICMSVDGSVLYASSDAGVIKKSIDYGNSWATVYTNGSSSALKRITCSGDGSKVLACFQSNNQLLLSSDSGQNFSSVGTSYSYFKVAMSSNGVYMLASVNGSRLCYSIDNGTTWIEINNNRFCAIAINYTGNIIYNVNPYFNVIVSESSATMLSTNQPLISSNGSTYFDNTTNKLYIYNGTAWKSITLA
jgi:photosystem II stability/assembly factor-like uncharacterized protein